MASSSDRIESPPQTTLAPGIHHLNNLGPAAAYVVETSDGLVLVDSGLESNGSAITRDFRYRKLDLASLRAILLTHAHGDHSLGAQYLRQTTGAKVYAGRDDSGVLRAGEPREAFFSAFDMRESKAHPTEVDVALKGGETIAVGDTTFKAIAAPGHTPGSMCYSLERGSERILFSGDVIMTVANPRATSPPSTSPIRGRTMGRSQELGTYATYLAPRYRGNAEAYLSTIRQLRELPVPDLVLPGHPQPDSPEFRISKSHWNSMLDQGAEDMSTLLAHYRADGRNFLDGSPKQLVPGLYCLGNLEGITVYCLNSNSGLFVINAPGGAGLVPFLESKIRALGIKPEKVTAVLITCCDSDAMSGLRSLVAHWGSRVVVSEAGLAEVKGACPLGIQVMTSRDLEKSSWFPVQTLALEGRGVGSTAYLLKWHDKDVLITPRIPINLTRSSEEILFQAISTKLANPSHYHQSLLALSKIKPDLWLPLVPMDGQNANLYGEEWQDILTSNRRLVDSIDPGP